MPRRGPLCFAPAARRYSWYWISVLKSFYTIYYSRNQSEIVYDTDVIHQENEKDAILYSLLRIVIAVSVPNRFLPGQHIHLPSAQSNSHHEPLSWQENRCRRESNPLLLLCMELPWRTRSQSYSRFRIFTLYSRRP
jgi:hypothetical protein